VADWAKLRPLDGELSSRSGSVCASRGLTLTARSPALQCGHVQRRNLFKRDHSPASIAAAGRQAELTIDHVIPRSREARPPGELRPACVAAMPEKPTGRRSSQHEAAQDPAPSSLEASVRRLVHPHRFLVAVPQRCLLKSRWKNRLSCQRRPRRLNNARQEDVPGLPQAELLPRASLRLCSNSSRAIDISGGASMPSRLRHPES